MSDLIITPSSGKIDFIYQSGQEGQTSRLESIIIDPIDGLVFSGKISASSVNSPLNITATSSNINYPFIFASSGETGAKSLLMDSAGGTYNPSTNLATVNISGTSSWATNAVTNANLTGDVTSVGNATTIANSVVTNAKLANSSVTIGSTAISLGAAGAQTTIVGLVSVTSTTFVGALTGTATTASYANALNAANSYTVAGITGNLTGTATTASYANNLNAANQYTVGGITGSHFGTSSWATNATNALQLGGTAAASYVTLTGAQTLTDKTITGTFTGNLTGTATTASYANALNAANNYTVAGITGNLTGNVTGTATTASYANALNAANRYTVVGITGSLFGTSSWATNATNALQLGGTAAASYVTLTGAQNLSDKTITGTFTGNLTGTATTASYANALNAANSYTVAGITGALTGTSSWATNALTATNATQLNGQAASYYTNIPARLGYTPVDKAGDTVTGNLIINGNFSVNGSFTAFSASNVYISSSQLYIEDNILTLNAFSPYLRYAGVEMYDSGSGTLSSLLWDGESDYFFLSGSSVNGKIITGPDSQANLSANFVPKATAGYKLGNSVIYDDGTNVGIGTTTPAGGFHINNSQGNFSEVLRLQRSGGIFYSVGLDTNFLNIAYNGNTNASNIFVLKTNGFLGLGNLQNANYNLDIASTQAQGIQLRYDTTTNYLARISPYWNSNTDTRIDFAINRSSGATPDVIMSVGYGGNVGIGTTSPAAKLQVNSTTAGATLLRTDGTNGTLFSVVDDLSDSLMSVNNSAGLPVLEVFADDRIVMGQYGQNDFVLVNNKVGIGTNNPSFKLDVTGSFGLNAGTNDGNWPFIVADSITSGGTNRYALNKIGAMGFNYADSYAQLQLIGANGAYIDFGNAAVDDSDARVIYYSNNRLDIQYGSIITLNSTGVGIGTTVPGTSLEVYAIPATSTTLRQMLIINTDFASATGTGFGGSIVFRGKTPGNLLRDNAQISAYNEDIGDNGYALGFYTRPNDGGGLQQRLTILRAGNVGIGTVGPGALLELSSSTATSLLNVKGAGGNGILFVSGSGNVGIGTTTTNHLLHLSTISNDVSVGLYTTNANASARNWLISANEVAYGDFNIKQSNAIGGNPRSAGTSRFYIQNDGNVGIGTTVPVAKLQVAGNISGSSFTSSISNAVGFLGTSSWASNAVTSLVCTGNAATATTASYANALNPANSYTVTGITGALTGNVTGTATTASYANALNAANSYTVTGITGNLTGNVTGTATTASYANALNAANSYTVTGITGALTGTATTASYANTLNPANIYTGLNFLATGYLQSGNGQIRSDTAMALLTTGGQAQIVSTKGILLGTSYDTNPGANEIRTTSNTSLYLNARGTGDIQFQTADSLKMMLLNNGNVGIGESSPIQKLHVLGNTVFGNFGSDTYKYNLYLSFAAAADESWVRIYLPQDFQSNNNGGTVKLRVLFAASHASFGAHQEYQISYKTYYPSPFLTFSKIICTNKTTDFGGGTYYPASSTPDVVFYSNADAYLYIKIKGFSAYNTVRFVEAEVFGRTAATPTITTTTAPASPTELTKTIQFLPQEGNIYADGAIGIGTTSPVSPLSVQSNAKQLRLQTTSGPTSFFTDIGARYDSSHPFTIEVANGAATATEYFGIYADAGGANNRIALLNGNVGIGTTNPVAKLHVQGNISGSSFTSSISNAVGFLGTSSWASNATNALQLGGTAAASYVTLADTQSLSNKTLTSPILVTPALGTPSSGNLTSCTFPTLNQNTTGTAATASYANALNPANSYTVTGITMTNLTGAYQNTTVYDSPRTQSATPSRGIRAPASSIQFTDSYAIAPYYTYRSTGDWPVPYGIGWGTGGESSGIFQRYASNGSSFGDMVFYTGNDGSGAFSFRRHVWESTTYFPAGSNHLNDELFRVDWAGNASLLGTLTANVTGNLAGTATTATTATTANALNTGNSYTVTSLTATNEIGTRSTNIGANLERGDATVTTLRFDSDNFRFYSGGTGALGEILRITEGGLVGIGTSIPSTLLHAYGADGRYFTFSGTSGLFTIQRNVITTGGSNPVLSLINTQGMDAAGVVGRGTAIQLDLGYGGSSSAVGTAARGARIAALGETLYDATAANQNAVLAFFTSTAGTLTEKLRIRSDGSLSPITVSSTTAGATLLRTDGTNGTLFSVVDDLSDSLMSVNNSAGLPVLEVFADDRIVAGQYGQNDFVVVNNKVGIGTNNPLAKLHVTSSTSIPSAIFMGGNVGIGTTLPTTPLHVVGVISGSSFTGAGTGLTGTATSLTAGTATNATQFGSEANTNFMRGLAGGTEANIDTYTDNGFRSIAYTGHGKGLLSFNVGSSIGTVQHEYFYNTPANGWRIRNKTDSTTWSAWGHVVMTDGNQGLLTGLVITSNYSGTVAGLSIGGTAATVTTNANLTGHITSTGNATILGSFTSAQLLAALTDETGTGASVFANSPTLVSPALGTPTSGVLTNCTGTAANLTAGAVTNGVYTTGNQSIAGNKTFTGTTIVTGSIETAAVRETFSAVSSTTTVSIDLSTATVFNLTFTSTISVFNITNVNTSRVNSFTLITAPNGTGVTIAWSFQTNGGVAANVKWASNVSPTATTTNGRFDIFSFVYNGTNWYGFTGGQNYV